MELFIGCKIIKAELMTDQEFKLHKNGNLNESMHLSMDSKQGYLVVYPDGYESWSPKETFENAYRLITTGEFKLIQDETSQVFK